MEYGFWPLYVAGQLIIEFVYLFCVQHTGCSEKKMPDFIIFAGLRTFICRYILENYLCLGDTFVLLEKSSNVAIFVNILYLLWWLFTWHSGMSWPSLML